MRLAIALVLLLAACVHVYTDRLPGEFVRPDASPGTQLQDGEYSYFQDQLADERHARTVSLMMEDCAPYGQNQGPAVILKEWTVDGRPPRHHVRYRCGADAGSD
jgi:hypothetical protein